jgi:phenylpyruvate tautomerase PptA (4-oxalocrotonate tautomerase family)
MPFVQISLREGKSPDYLKAVSDSIHDAVVHALHRADNDYFHILTEHPPHQWFIDKSYMDIERSDDCIVVYITMRAGRTAEIKRDLYQQMAENLSQRPGLRKEDLIVIGVDNAAENWSFGKGIGQASS